MKGCTLKPVGVDWCLLIASSFCFSRFLLVLKASEKWSDHLALEGPGELVGSHFEFWNHWQPRNLDLSTASPCYKLACDPTQMQIAGLGTSMQEVRKTFRLRPEPRSQTLD